MRFYVLSSNPTTYNFAHSDVWLAYHFAHGLWAAGHDVTVLWRAEEPSEFRGIPHRFIGGAEPEPDDIVLAAFAPFGWQMLDGVWPKLLRSKRRWLYAFSYQADKADRYWQFEHVFCESSEAPAQIKHPSVHWLMAGVPVEVDTERASPYPPSGLHMFYAGRMGRVGGDGTMTLFRGILEQLPDSAHLWYGTNTLCITPEDVARAPYLAPWVNQVAHSASEAIWEQPWRRQKTLWMEKEMFRVVADVLFNHPRAHCLGPMSYGTFWHWLNHADVYLDHGFAAGCPAINCKIMDPLAVGCPIVTDGLSPSYYLLDKYRAGVALPYMDHVGMAKAVLAAADEPSWQRADRGRAIRDAESWDMRVFTMLKLAGV